MRSKKNLAGVAVVVRMDGCWPPWRPHRALAPMNKDAQGRWKVGMSNTKLKMRVQTA